MIDSMFQLTNWLKSIPNMKPRRQQRCLDRASEMFDLAKTIDQRINPKIDNIVL